MGHESLIQKRPSLSHPGWLKYFFRHTIRYSKLPYTQTYSISKNDGTHSLQKVLYIVHGAISVFYDLVPTLTCNFCCRLDAVRSKSQALKLAAEQYMKHMRETSFNFLVHTYTIYKQCSVCFDTGSQAYLIYVTTITTGCIKNLAKCKIFHLERENSAVHRVKFFTQFCRTNFWFTWTGDCRKRKIINKK